MITSISIDEETQALIRQISTDLGFTEDEVKNQAAVLLKKALREYARKVAATQDFLSRPFPVGL